MMSNQTTDLDSRIREMAGRIRALREIENLTPEKMAEFSRAFSSSPACLTASGSSVSGSSVAVSVAVKALPEVKPEPLKT